MRTDFMCLLFTTILYSLLYLTFNVNSQLDENDERENSSLQRNEFRSEKSDSDSRRTEMRETKNRQSQENSKDSHSSSSGDFGFQSSQRKFQLKYANRRKSDIYTSGYQTFLGKRRRGSKSHVKTTFRKRSSYDHNGRKKRSSIFESYGEADSFDRKKIRDVFDVNGYISEGRKRTKLGGYIQEDRHAFVSGGHKSQASRNNRKSSEDGSHFVNETHNQGSRTHNLKKIDGTANSTIPRRRK
ncbi:unnamed protein product [Schistosoma margrebowiei]|uniref:Trematode Eggshell Synthesis domain containing protein n=1 Tax=Schistosoma margrebowiei TaxID=48269 RepID=A0AA85A722_9TREM|nr:unnamed protein product [Schistosoma margrebowiei]